MKRLIIVHWNKSTGPEPIIQYPPEKKVPSKDLFLKIWALHELDKESSIIEFIPDKSDPETKNEQFISIIQKFEGEIYFLVIVYVRSSKLKEMIKEYSDLFATISKNLIELINTNKITFAISDAFNTIKNYSKLKKEENLINFFKDKIKYTILKILRNGIISKLRLSEILTKEYGFSTINFDLLLISFIRENLIVKKNVPGSKECYFLVRDLSCTRLPPNKIPSIVDEEILEDYKQKLTHFYINFNFASEFENKTVMNFLMDKDVYFLLEKLRKRSLSVKTCLNTLNNKEELFSELLKNKIIYETKGKVFLFSDIRFIKFTPYYIIERLLTRYRVDKDISFDEYLTHLKLLTEQFGTYPSLIDYEII